MNGLAVARAAHLEVNGQQLIARLVGVAIFECAPENALSAHHARSDAGTAISVREHHRTAHGARGFVPSRAGLAVLDRLHAGFEGAEISGLQGDEERLCSHASTIADRLRPVGEAGDSHPQLRMARN